MKQGDIVRWKKPLNAGEAEERFVLLDNPAELERVDIRYICRLPIPPVQRINRDEVEPVPGVEIAAAYLVVQELAECEDAALNADLQRLVGEARQVMRGVR